MAQTGMSYNQAEQPLAETITADGKYRYRLFSNDVVGIQKPDSTSSDGWATEYVFRDGVCPCQGHQYRGDCRHKGIAQSLISWWRDVGQKAATQPPASAEA